MGRLAGKRAIVTGASSGIGRAIANRFAAEGAAVAACGRDAERVERTVEEIQAAGGTATGLLGDVATVEGARSVAEAAAEQLGGIDVLINNAGIDVSDWRDLHEWPVEEFDRVLATNLRGPFLMSKFTLPHLLAAGGGSIVHISSVCAITVLGRRLRLRHLQGRAEHALRPHRRGVRPARNSLEHAHARRDRHRAARLGDGRDERRPRLRARAALASSHRPFRQRRGVRRGRPFPQRGRRAFPDGREDLDRRRPTAASKRG